MKLLYQTHSPYARKVLVAAHEMGLEHELTVIHHETSPTRRNEGASHATPGQSREGCPGPTMSRRMPAQEEVFALNPLGKVPVLICSDGTVVYDSNVICEYLDGLHTGTRLIPRAAPARWQALKMQALAQGICDAGIAARWESVRRPAQVRWPTMQDGQIQKIAAACDFLEQELALVCEPGAGQSVGPDIGDIALATALSWIEFRGVYPFSPGGRDWGTGIRP